MQKRRIFYLLFILILLTSSYVSYEYGHSTGYHEGYFNGSIDGYITNKYITHDFANFSAEQAVKETNQLKSLRGKNLSECDKILRNS